MPEIAVPTPSSVDAIHLAGRKPTIRSLLREATAPDHQRLDSLLATLDLQALAGYRRFLEINAAALLPLERALIAGGVNELLPNWEQRARSKAVLADLDAVGGTARPLAQPGFYNRFDLLGTLYVLEGSRLGAAYLIKNVKRSADPRVSGATSYLGHGEGLKLWPSFITVLEGHADELTDPDEIVEPAKRAFDLFTEAVVQP
jgi:heme oxygenase (biliverdin-IX-beta and delta-forming)